VDVCSGSTIPAFSRHVNIKVDVKEIGYIAMNKTAVAQDKKWVRGLV
jgi:hypothetical protein